MKTKKDSKTKKGIIDRYYNEIYDVYLVVANENVTFKQLQSKYTYGDGEELDEDILNSCCSTAKCKDRNADTDVILVKYNHGPRDKARDKRLDLVNVASHEATHTALDIYEWCGQNVCFCSPEPFCYLQGWAAERIYKTLTK